MTIPTQSLEEWMADFEKPNVPLFDRVAALLYEDLKVLVHRRRLPEESWIDDVSLEALAQSEFLMTEALEKTLIQALYLRKHLYELEGS